MPTVRAKGMAIREGVATCALGPGIPPELTATMHDMSGFRNVVVHGYQEVDLHVLEDVIAHRLDDLLSYCTVVRGRLIV